MSRKNWLEALHVRFSPESTVISANISTKMRVTLLAVSVAFALGAVASAKSDHRDTRAASGYKVNDVTVGVDNFGKVTDFYYRGAQPKSEEYAQLAAIGVRTVIDLRDDPTEFAKGSAEQAGMKYVNLPMSDKAYPSPDAATKFLTLINDKENWPVYVHCAGGRHRTGAMTAVFRMTNQGWDINRAYEEMKDYDFYTRWGHKAMKKFVYDYYRGLSTRQVEQQVADSINR
jgi:protein-tyrosine phosphatase